MKDGKKTLYSAVQPTNNLTIGNYIGAIRNFVALQKDYDCYFAIANMHAITVRQNPAESRKKRGLRAIARARPRGTMLGA